MNTQDLTDQLVAVEAVANALMEKAYKAGIRFDLEASKGDTSPQGNDSPSIKISNIMAWKAVE